MFIRFLPPRAACTAFIVLSLAALNAGAATVTVTATVDNTTVDGQCTLREAILAVNAGAGSADCPSVGAWGAGDTIAFNLSVPGSIQPATQLPALTRSSVVIDGYTQPGASSNTLAGQGYPGAQGLDAVLVIRIDGSQAPGADGLRLNAQYATVRGLSIVNFEDGAAIRVLAGGAQVQGNFIGRWPDGVTPGRNNWGVFIDHAAGASIGGASAAARNLVAQSRLVDVRGDTANGLSVVGNLIGATRTGGSSGAVQQGSTGVWLNDGASPQVHANVITDHDGDGVYLAGTVNASVLANTIGEGVAGAGQTFGNGGNGVVIVNSGFSSSSALVSTNGIGGNARDGIQVLGINLVGDPVGNRLDNNAIYANGGLGINLRPQGEGVGTVTPNDAGDSDSGPNGLQNFPVITSAQMNANGSITIGYTLNSTANTPFEVSAYASSVCARQGAYGAGQLNQTVTSNGAGLATGTITLPAPLPPGWGAGGYVNLLAHNTLTSNTSEFSDCAQVAPLAGNGTPPVMYDVPDQAGMVGTPLILDLPPYVQATDGDAVDYVVVGALPPGLQLVQLPSGRITGTPTQAGTYTVQVYASDKDGSSSVDSVTFTIASAGGGSGNPGNPGGPGSVTAIPTLSEWGRLLVSLLAGAMGWLALRRRA